MRPHVNSVNNGYYFTLEVFQYDLEILPLADDVRDFL